jgi:hypothetical protein
VADRVPLRHDQPAGLVANIGARLPVRRAVWAAILGVGIC